jgi:hypothetical protein
MANKLKFRASKLNGPFIYNEFGATSLLLNGQPAQVSRNQTERPH